MTTPADKKGAKALARQTKREAVPGSAQASDAGLPVANAQAKSAVRLAQIINLHLAGLSFAQIGAEIGASAEEIDRLVQADAARYIRSQPQLRLYARNWLSEHYTQMLEAVWAQSTDPNHPRKLEHQDRALRILDSMRKLHGADAPTQTEVSVEAAPEAVERLVQALSAQQGFGYDVNVFDIVDGEVIHDAAEQAEEALADSAALIEREAAE